MANPFNKRPVKDVEQFIADAGNPGMEEPVMQNQTTENAVPSTGMSADHPPYPWESAREDYFKIFNVKLSEKHILMLRWISENSPFNQSMQKFCQQHLTQAIEERVAEMTQE